MDSLNKWLTLLANIGVLAGVIFLAVEVDQSNKQASADAYQERVNEIDQANSSIALSADLSGIYVKLAQSGMESLTPLELYRVERWEVARINRMQGQLYQYEQGFIDKASYERMLFAGSRQYELWSELDLGNRYPELVDIIQAHMAISD